MQSRRYTLLRSSTQPGVLPCQEFYPARISIQSRVSAQLRSSMQSRRYTLLRSSTQPGVLPCQEFYPARSYIQSRVSAQLRSSLSRAGVITCFGVLPSQEFYPARSSIQSRVSAQLRSSIQMRVSAQFMSSLSKELYRFGILPPFLPSTQGVCPSQEFFPEQELYQS